MHEVISNYISNHPNYKDELDEEISNLIDASIEEEECKLEEAYSNLYFSLRDYIEPTEFLSRYAAYKRVRYFMDKIENIFEDKIYTEKIFNPSNHDYFRDNYDDRIKIDIRDLSRNDFRDVYEIINKYADETMEVR